VVPRSYQGGGYAILRCAGRAVPPDPVNGRSGSAGAMPETFFTVWTNVFERGRLRAANRFVHGGASGSARRPFRWRGRSAHGCSRRLAPMTKRAACERLSAERAINHKTEDFPRCG
jgi:NADPH2:quinone reductase